MERKFDGNVRNLSNQFLDVGNNHKGVVHLKNMQFRTETLRAAIAILLETNTHLSKIKESEYILKTVLCCVS